jgi:hypothetical protein
MSQFDPLELETPLPPARPRRRSFGFRMGVVLVVLGLFLLLENLGLLTWLNWGVVLPVVVIMAGVYLLFRRR